MQVGVKPLSQKKDSSTWHFKRSSSHHIARDVTDTNGLRKEGKMVHVSNLPPIPLEHKPSLSTSWLDR
jgi:hypothetical protein